LRWFVRIALPLVVCSGLFVMHGLDGPSAHGAGASHAGVHHAAAGADRAVEAGHRLLVEAVDGWTGGDDHCTGCIDAVHVVAACLAVLAAAVVLALRWPGVVTAQAAEPIGERGRPVDVPAQERGARPAWVRLAVMLC
jgi:hypothetical protein